MAVLADQAAALGAVSRTLLGVRDADVAGLLRMAGQAGAGVGPFWSACVDGRSALRPATRFDTSDLGRVQVGEIDRAEPAGGTRASDFALSACEEALAAAGDTGHRVVHEADLIGADNAVRAMRQRAAYLVEYSAGLTTRSQLAAEIRALPLPPSEDEGTAADHASTLDQLATRLRDDREDYADPCRSYTVIVDIDVYCEHSSGAGHSGQHYADVAGRTRTWTDPDGSDPAPVHAATPEGITPCGQGTRDVTTDGMITDITCVECLRAIAIEKGEQPGEMRRELEATLKAGRGTSWPSLLRQVEELRARGEDAPEADRAEAQLRHVRVRANLAHSRGQSNTKLISELVETVGNHHDRVAQLERDIGHAENRLTSLETYRNRLGRLHERAGAAEFRLDALELAQREAAQPGGTEENES